MIVFQNDFCIFSYDDSNKIFTLEYTGESINLSNESYDKFLDLLESFVNETMPEYLISDIRDLQYIVTPVQKNRINAIFGNAKRMRKLKKLAKVVTPDVFVQRSVNKKPDEDSLGLNFTQKYFTKSEDAIKWLTQNN